MSVSRITEAELAATVVHQVELTVPDEGLDPLLSFVRRLLELARGQGGRSLGFFLSAPVEAEQPRITGFISFANAAAHERFERSLGDSAPAAPGPIHSSALRAIYALPPDADPRVPYHLVSYH